MAHLATALGQLREAQQHLDAARNRHSGGATFSRLYIESNEGHLDLLRGRLCYAAAHFRSPSTRRTS